MNKSELIEAVAASTGETKSHITLILKGICSEIEERVAAGEQVTLVAFGSFKRIERKARRGRNPKTGQPLKIKGKNVPKFVAGSRFKRLVNGDMTC